MIILIPSIRVCRKRKVNCENKKKKIALLITFCQFQLFILHTFVRALLLLVLFLLVLFVSIVIEQ